MPARAPADAVFAVAWNSARGDQVATGGGDDRAFLWQVRHAAPVRAVHSEVGPWLKRVRGAWAQVTAEEQSAAATELTGHSDSVRSARCTAAGRAACARSLARLTWAGRGEQRCRAAQVSSLAFNVAGTLLASGGLDGT